MIKVSIFQIFADEDRKIKVVDIGDRLRSKQIVVIGSICIGNDVKVGYFLIGPSECKLLHIVHLFVGQTISSIWDSADAPYLIIF